MKVSGNQSTRRRGKYAGVRTYRVAPYGSDLSPTWLNICADLRVRRRSVQEFWKSIFIMSQVLRVLDYKLKDSLLFSMSPSSSGLGH